MRLSKIFSFVFHPALMPTYAFILALNFVPIFRDFMPDQQKIHFLKLVFIFTFLIPIFSVIFLKKIKLVSSYYMENKAERRAPLFIAIISYYFLLKFFHQIHVSHLLNKLLIGALIILIIALFISKFWKISLHMLGIGGFVGAFLALHYLFGGNLFLILLLLFCSGLVAYARINENAHTLKQVYIGFLVGVSAEFLLFYF